MLLEIIVWCLSNLGFALTVSKQQNLDLGNTLTLYNLVSYLLFTHFKCSVCT